MPFYQFLASEEEHHNRNIDIRTQISIVYIAFLFWTVAALAAILVSI